MPCRLRWGLMVLNRNTAAKLIHNCWGKNQQSVLGQFSIGRVGQFSVGANNRGRIRIHVYILDQDPAYLFLAHCSCNRKSDQGRHVNDARPAIIKIPGDLLQLVLSGNDFKLCAFDLVILAKLFSDPVSSISIDI